MFELVQYKKIKIKIEKMILIGWNWILQFFYIYNKILTYKIHSMIIDLYQLNINGFLFQIYIRFNPSLFI